MLNNDLLKKISEMSDKELKEALSRAKVSDAPVDIKDEYIKVLESALGLKYAGEVAIQQYYDCEPDFLDMMESY